MKFLYPEILWGLLALVIPILVHLFNFRKFKRIQFSNVEFLKDIKQETQSKSKLKHLLILLSRLLAITAIVLAFAQPFIPLADEAVKPRSTSVSMYLDNSFSMEAENESGRLLDVAKNKALEILDIYKSTDQFQLITNDFEGRHQRLVSKEEMVDLIEEIELSIQAKNINEVLSRQKDVLMESLESSKVSYILSDLQKSTHDFSKIQSDSNIVVRMVPTVSLEQSNCFIDSVWFETPVRQINQSERLRIKLVNQSKKEVSALPLKLVINGKQKAVASFNVEAESTLDTVVVFTNTEPGFKSANLQLSDFPIEFDNNYYFSFNVVEQIKIYEIKGRTAYGSHVSKVFNDDPYFNFRSNNESLIDYSILTEVDYVVLNQLNNISTGLSSELQKFAKNGGSILVIPSKTTEITSYNAFLTSVGGPNIQSLVNSKNKVSKINTQHPIYQTVFEGSPNNMNLPVMNSFYKLNLTGKNTAKMLMQNLDGSPFLTENKVGFGSLYLCCVSLNPDQSNFGQHAIFVASMIRMAEFSQAVLPLEYAIGGGESVKLRGQKISSESIFKIRGEDKSLEFLPGVRASEGITELFVYDGLNEAGLYDVLRDDNKIASLAFNYERDESYMETYTLDELQEIILNQQLSNFSILDAETDSIRAKAEELSDGKKLWRILIILALLFLIIELLLIKFWK